MLIAYQEPGLVSLIILFFFLFIVVAGIAVGCYHLFDPNGVRRSKKLRSWEYELGFEYHLLGYLDLDDSDQLQELPTLNRLMSLMSWLIPTVGAERYYSLIEGGKRGNDYDP